MVYDNNEGGEYGKYFVQELQEPASMGTPEFRELYKQFAKRILWMDSNVCEGAFQMNTAWYFAAAPREIPSSPSTSTTTTSSSVSTGATRTTPTSSAASSSSP